MKKRDFNVVGYEPKYWRVMEVGGIVFICLGTWIIFSPETSYVFLSWLLAIGLLTTGLFEALFSIFHSKKIKSWGWIFTGGLVDAVLVVYLLNYPLLSLILMPMIIGIWLLLRGFMTVSSTLVLTILGIRDWIWLILTSLVLILPSLIILYYSLFK